VDLSRQRVREWPVLRSAQELVCDGRNPHTDSPCRLGYHQGHTGTRPAPHGSTTATSHARTGSMAKR
jgi:hypothetical protein